MKKFFTSVGLMALGASSVHAQYAPDLTPQETSKPWSVSASLRGFYDDNFTTLPKNIPSPTVPGAFIRGAHDTFGTEVSPSASYNYSGEQTLLSASYVYDLRYYARSSTTDQTHQLNAKLDHAISERYKIVLNESFVIAQEPTVLDPSVVSSALRTSGSNVRNLSSMDFSAELTKELDLHLGYANTLYSYEQGGSSVPFGPYDSHYSLNPANPANFTGGASRSALLDRMEQLLDLDLRWKVLPETTAILGDQIGVTDYTSTEGIVFTPTPPAPAATAANVNYYSNYRDNRSDYLFVGADQTFTPALSASFRVGGEYIDYTYAHTSKVSPYADANVTWHYLPDSYVQVGVNHRHNATDVVGMLNSAGSPVLDAESTALYASVSHKITGALSASVLAQYQDSTFNGGTSGANGGADYFRTIGLNFAYHFNPFILAEAGYNYSDLSSDIGYRGYTRNQVYLGVRATY